MHIISKLIFEFCTFYEKIRLISYGILCENCSIINKKMLALACVFRCLYHFRIVFVYKILHYKFAMYDR